MDNGEWAYGYLVRHPSAVQIGDSSNPWYIHVPPADPDDNGGVYNTDPATVGQYTGLKDKNGMKIFEGDVVLCTSNFDEVAGKVVFNERTAGFEIWCSFVCGAYGEMATRKTNMAHYEEYRIVGNIHDNPGMMKQESPLD